MAQSLKVTPPRHCPRCAGPMFRDYYDDFGCLWCGEQWSAGPPVMQPQPIVHEGPRKRGRPRKHPIAAA
jgi:hypothetical protein